MVRLNNKVYLECLLIIFLIGSTIKLTSGAESASSLKATTFSLGKTIPAELPDIHKFFTFYHREETTPFLSNQQLSFYNSRSEDDPSGVIPTILSSSVGANGVFSVTATNDAGNTTKVNRLVTTEDNSPPTWGDFPSEQYLDCGDETSPIYTGEPTATDNSGSVAITFTDSIITGVCSGSSLIERTWTATDASENTIKRIQQININDVTPPVINCGNFSVENPDSIPESTEFKNITFYDECSGIDTIIVISEKYMGLDQVAGFCPDAVVRTYRVYDNCGNTAECTQTITMASRGTCEVCQSEVPFYAAYLEGSPDSLWLSPNIRRNGICCGVTQEPGEGPPRCVSFNVFLDENAVGMVFDIYSGAEPSGALFYQIDCGPEIPVGEFICLDGGKSYTLTFCKPGANRNVYSIQSIKGGITADSLTTRADENCTETLNVTGLVSSTVTWSVVSPNDQSLLRYLDTTDPLNPTFNPDFNVPSTIVYEVCGQLEGTYVCNEEPECKRSTITVLPPISLDFDMTPDAICKNDIPKINALVSPIDYSYNYGWYDAPDGKGKVISTEASWTPTEQGEYSLLISEDETGIGCNTVIKNFTVSWDTIGPSMIMDVPDLELECSTPNAEDIIADWINQVEAYEWDGSSIPVENDYTPFTHECGAEVTVTFRSTDKCGNTSTVTGTIIINDTSIPVINGEAQDEFVECDGDDPSQNPAFLSWVNNHGNATASDVCDSNLAWTSNAAMQPWVGNACSQTKEVTFTVTDDCGNSSTTTANFTIVDTTPPEASNIASVIVQCIGDIPVADITDVVDEADICTVIPNVTWLEDVSDNNSCPETITRTYSVADDCGNSVNVTQTIIVKDTIAPTFSVPADIAVSKDTDCNYNVSIAITGDVTDENDNCSTGLEATYSDVEYPGPCDGSVFIARTWVLVDDCDNSTTKVQSITVLDNNLTPTFTIPADTTISKDENCEYDASPAITGLPSDLADNCTPVDDLVVSYSDEINTGTCEGEVIINRTWTVTDNCGNRASQIQLITVTDNNELPSFTVPADTIISKDGNCEYNASPDLTGSPTDLDDNCTSVGNLVISYSDVVNPGTCIGEEIVNRTWIVTDDCENSTSQVQTITIIDTQVPVFDALPETITDINCSNALPSQQVLTATDACSNATVVSSIDPYTVDVCGGYSITYRWTATDDCGNATEASQKFNVLPAPSPIFDFVADTVINCADYAFYSSRALKYSNSESGVCEISGSANGIISGTLNNCGGTLTETWQFTDDCRNTISQSRTITLIDTIAPIISCPSVELFAACVLDDLPAYDSYLKFSNAGGQASDNCSLDTSSFALLSEESDGMSCPETITRTYMITDACGNTATCNQTIVIHDLIAPVVTAPTALKLEACNTTDITTALNGSALSYSSVLDTISLGDFQAEGGSAKDNCSIALITYVDVTDGGLCSEVVTRYFTVTDNCGNSTVVTQTITLDDITSPTLSCMEGVTVPADYDEVYATITLEEPTIGDNCTATEYLNIGWIMKGATTANGTDTIPIPYEFNIGTTTVTYVVSDDCGNTTSCSFEIDVTEKPKILCASDTTVYADLHDNNATLDPGHPTLQEGALPIIWTWTIEDEGGNLIATGGEERNDTSVPHVSPNPFTFPVGENTITWRAENFSGFDECIQTIIVIDVQAPIAIDDNYEVSCEEQLFFITDNDEYDENYNIVVSILDWPQQGILYELDNQGTVSYAVDYFANVTDSFTYTICLDMEQTVCDTATVRILIPEELDCDLAPTSTPQDTTCHFFVPEGFSPNGDGVHDYFVIDCIEQYPNAKLMILDKQGYLLYEKEDYGNVKVWGCNEVGLWWGGQTIKCGPSGDKMVIPGVYLYVLDKGNGDLERGFVMVAFGEKGAIGN